MPAAFASSPSRPSIRSKVALSTSMPGCCRACAGACGVLRGGVTPTRNGARSGIRPPGSPRTTPRIGRRRRRCSSESKRCGLEFLLEPLGAVAQRVGRSEDEEVRRDGEELAGSKAAVVELPDETRQPEGIPIREGRCERPVRPHGKWDLRSRRARTLTPRAHAPSKSLWSASRLRSRVVNGGSSRGLPRWSGRRGERRELDRRGLVVRDVDGVDESGERARLRADELGIWIDRRAEFRSNGEAARAESLLESLQALLQRVRPRHPDDHAAELSRPRRCRRSCSCACRSSSRRRARRCSSAPSRPCRAPARRRCS